MKKICILDYGLGNTKSLFNSLKKIGYEPNFYSEKKELTYDVLFIPGVGSFNTAIKLFKKKNYFTLIKKFHKQNTLIFGICLGMQLLLSIGYEDDKNEGLNLIEGKVIKMNQNIIIPAIGWNRILFNTNKKFNFLKKYNNQRFYFIHSYYAKLKNDKNQLFSSNYFNFKYTSAICSNKNIIGTQFHPEKSGELGLDFIKDILINT